MNPRTTPATAVRFEAARALLALAACLLAGLAWAATDTRGIGVVAAPSPQHPASRPGFALLIGASQYQSPRWSDLVAVPGELTLVGEALRRQGFAVRIELDLPSSRLFEVIREFISTRGSDPANRLVIYFAGHGYSRDQGKRGYLVPVDAPHPRDDQSGFLARAIDMSQVLAWARQIESRQALFLFDSCFSGTVLQQRGAEPSPALIERLLAEPVRQFITAGTAGEPVPAKSDFAPALVRALDTGLGDLNQDGLTTGTELGLYLQGHIAHFGRQTPWFGKIPDPELSRGEFVFRSGRPRTTAASATALPAPRPIRPARLHVESHPTSSEVVIDGRVYGRTPLSIDGLAAGSHELALRQSGYRAWRQTIRVEAGETQKVSTTLEPLPRNARLVVEAEPATASIDFIDGRYDYREGMELPPGRYRLRIAAAGYTSRETDVEVGRTDAKVVVALERESPRITETRPSRSLARRDRGTDSSMFASTPVDRPTTCYARNSFGQSFWWLGPSANFAYGQVLRVCQMNTPMGAVCFPAGCQ